MKLWRPLAVVSGAIIAVVMAFASISYNMTLGTTEPAFGWLPQFTNAFAFASLALAFDLGMIASVFGVLHWWDTSRSKAAVCAILFVIASSYSVHSVRGYIASNLTRSQAPAARAADVYASLRIELQNDQDHLAQLRTKRLEAQRRSNRRELQRDIAQLSRKIDELRTRLAATDNGRHVSPLHGLEWFLAITLWFFNATCWTAWFGSKTRAPLKTHDQVVNDSVVGWLRDDQPEEPQHCLVLYRNYARWCAHRGAEPLAQYSFYARLVELGARKFRDGRNGPTMYALPEHAS